MNAIYSMSCVGGVVKFAASTGDSCEDIKRAFVRAYPSESLIDIVDEVRCSRKQINEHLANHPEQQFSSGAMSKLNHRTNTSRDSDQQSSLSRRSD